VAAAYLAHAIDAAYVYGNYATSVQAKGGRFCWPTASR
jgi:hypothetical protein